MREGGGLVVDGEPVRTRCGTQFFHHLVQWSSQGEQAMTEEPQLKGRRWYQRKRFLIPVGLFIALFSLGVLVPVDDDSVEHPAAEEAEAEPADDSSSGEIEALEADVAALEEEVAALEEDLATAQEQRDRYKDARSELLEDTSSEEDEERIAELEEALEEAGSDDTEETNDENNEDTEEQQATAPEPEQESEPDPEPEESTLTAGQENALGSARDYLNLTAFSRSGLIEQLEFEGYSTEDATYAVDAVNVDWKEQAAKSAEEYLSFSSFSRSGLIEQLEFEGFSAEQAEYGVTQAGL